MKADAEGVVLVGELVDKVTSVAPERVGLGGVEGRASALLVVVVV